MTWRVGTKNPHALYKDDLPAGFVIDAVDAMALCDASNELDARKEELGASKRTTSGDRAIGAMMRIRRVLDDFFDSPEPRSMAHALHAIRSIADEGK